MLVKELTSQRVPHHCFTVTAVADVIEVGLHVTGGEQAAAGA